MDVAIDSPERDVEFLPTKTPYDPRHMLAGTVGPDGTHTLDARTRLFMCSVTPACLPACQARMM